MEINLRNESRIAEVKDAFHKKFPFLKLEFFYPLADERKRYHANNVIKDAHTNLGDIAGMNKPGYVRIHEFRTVADVEHCFGECFGLYVQIFRRSGGSWLETTDTDKRTLAEQNQLGREKSQAFIPVISTEDIHEQE
jgi:hypothetical protein